MSNEKQDKTESAAGFQYCSRKVATDLSEADWVGKGDSKPIGLDDKRLIHTSGRR
jgi:hypothetical protein